MPSFERTLQKEIYLCLKEVSLFVKFPGQVFEERISMATSVTVILLHMFFLCLDLLWSAQIADHSRENRLGYLAMRLTYGVILFKAGLVFCSAFLYVYLYYILYIGMRACARVCVCVCVCVCVWLGGRVLTRTSM